MADLGRRRPRARTLISAGIAVAAHLLLILALAVGIRVMRSPIEAPAIEVTLVKLFTPHPKPIRMVQPRQPVVAQAQPALKPSPTPPLLPPPQALPANGPIDPHFAAADAVRGALQATVRCANPDAFNMGSAEREACDKHVHDLRAGAPAYGVFADDHMRHDPPVASHGMAAHVGQLSPRPGYYLGRCCPP